MPRLRRGRHLGLVVIAALIATTAIVPSTPAAAPVPTLDWHACHPAQSGFQCATARVPRDYDDPHGAKIHLAVMRHRATDPAHPIGTMFFNPGGPGAPGAKLLPDVYDDFPAAVRTRFNVASWDPRGVGDSTAVHCFASRKAERHFFAGGLWQGFPVGMDEMNKWIRRYREFGRRCERRNGGFLRHLSTADTARDLNLLRRAVGDRKLSYVGASYGTFLGATYANLFPKRVRAVVLDGNLNPRAWVHKQLKPNGGAFLDTYLRQHGDQGAARTLDAFLDLCGDAAHCAFSAGSPAATEDKFAALLRRLRTDPASADIGYAELVSNTGGALYNTQPDPAIGDSGWRGLAECLEDVWSTGHRCKPAWPAHPYEGQDQNYAIKCSESPNPRPGAFRSEDRFAYQRSGSLGPWWAWQAEPCASWPATAADRYAGPWDRRTANPVLVVGNAVDPATPYRGSLAMARQLGRARLLTNEGYGHTSGGDTSACIESAFSAYLIDKDLPPKGKTCQPDQGPFGGTP